MKIITGGNVAQIVKITTENYYEIVIKEPLIELTDYIDTMEREIDKRAKNSDNYYYQTLKSGEKARYAYIDKVDEIWKYENTFPRILRNSSLTSIYSFLEERLFYICFTAAKKLQIKSLNKFQMEQKAIRKSINGIFLAEKYLKGICSINFNSVADEWEIIKNFNQIRNCIVHARGNTKDPFYLEKNKTTYLRKSINSLNSRGVDVKDGFIYLNQEACYELIRASEKVLQHSYIEFNKLLK